MIKNMEKEFFTGRMAENLKDTGKMENRMDLDNSLHKMEIYLRVFGNKEKKLNQYKIEKTNNKNKISVKNTNVKNKKNKFIFF